MRDLTHYVQDMRKKAGFNIEDHIGLAFYTNAELAQILQQYGEVLVRRNACQQPARLHRSEG